MSCTVLFFLRDKDLIFYEDEDKNKLKTKNDNNVRHQISSANFHLARRT